MAGPWGLARMKVAHGGFGVPGPCRSTRCWRASREELDAENAFCGPGPAGRCGRRLTGMRGKNLHERTRRRVTETNGIGGPDPIVRVDDAQPVLRSCRKERQEGKDGFVLSHHRLRPKGPATRAKNWGLSQLKGTEIVVRDLSAGAAEALFGAG